MPVNSRLHIPAVACCFLSLACPAAVADASIGIRVASPLAPVLPGSEGNRVIQLPALSYTFELRAECPEDYAPESLSLNVADTRKSLDAAAIAATGLRDLELKIPARQIAPLAVDDFCAIEPSENGEQGNTRVADAGREMTLPDLLTVQVSLLCANDGDRTMTYASRALDVTLKCELPEAQKTDVAL